MNYFKSRLFWKILLVFALVFTGFGCVSTRNINMENDRGKAVMGLDYRDFQEAADEAVMSIITSPSFKNNGGGRYILAISDIINDTMQRIDTDQLVKKIRVDLLQSGRFMVTTAISAHGKEDAMLDKARNLRTNDEFNQGRVAGKGQMIAPDFSLSGKIVQKNVKVDRSTQQVEYYFQLTLTDIKTGLALWEGEYVVGKRGSNKSVSW